jgi:acetolactate synthase-1/2/3 large subunit
MVARAKPATGIPLGNQTPRPAAVASMALYSAWCDREPVYMMVGNTVDATKRAPGGEWVHSVQDAAATVRDFVKWDDLPGSLTHFGESAVRV